ncbi:MULTISPECIES: hypothetical protein [unclassified Mesorhizobium]|uniref:hypothetical protein n=1 Tax=unclassified Mesorhizobium TaxID=325217 RepID=UPI000FCB96FD|nr:MULTISPECIES: hypothetical protein [unclassified Mesorhizobium]TIT80561.1 MAG: hypothetical protein E5W57_02165 [Mesorhizobium sp.]TGP23309.1 hypothetical protein EN874_017210 [Mesorhizobium sp. M1D.F.Ca.ET.231.01.1.1]TGP32371.1 hypothetical protein EN877_17215 [Mesorhizobium sp. M1D.F.Ca.ET.234.01.1.1]TGS46835.1 hypothetical protein EN827_17210 [Mesorhizobium sp. M1D.F.Ca.ET.184.01.1.1]TGS61661.1 hypothetical protein EN826_017210 [Mesorhizobium sp. M1D.F.Ca.ET.183.01.1.1]
MPRQAAKEPGTGRPKKPRSRPLKGEEAEVNHIVETQNISPAQARELVRRYGNDWRKIEEAAKTYKENS